MTTKSQKAKKTILEHREQVLVNLAELSAYSKDMRSDIVDIKVLLGKQNDRIRKNEKSISRIFGIGTTFFGIMTALITWLFKK